MPKRYWWKDAKIYELYVDRFAGNFQNLTNHLDYLERLGVNTLHILPHYPSPMADGGYDVMDYLNIRPELGTMEDFDRFLAQAHKRDIRVIVDMLLNHVSEHHPWFIEARKDKNSVRRDYFLWSETGTELALAWNAPSGFKESNWIWNEETNDYYYATFYPYQPDLNWDNPDVADSMIANMDFWAGRGVDGFRIDAAASLVKRDENRSKGLPETHAILKRIRRHLDQKYGGNVIILAEAHQDVADMRQYFGDGDECHLVYHFTLTEQIFVGLMRRDTKAIENTIKEGGQIPENCAWAVFLRNHDELSLETLPQKEQEELVTLLDPDRRYIFKGRSESDYTTSMRLGSIFENEPDRILEAFQLLYSIQGAPVMYYGDEIGMRNLPVMEGVVDTRLYVRGEFDWVEAQRQTKDPDSLFNRTRNIIHQALWPYGKKFSPGSSTDSSPKR